MTEMNKLIAILAMEEIPFEVIENIYWDNTPQVWIPNKKKPIADIICHSGSYGGNEGLLEIMADFSYDNYHDSVKGYLTANEALNIIWDVIHNQSKGE